MKYGGEVAKAEVVLSRMNLGLGGTIFIATAKRVRTDRNLGRDVPVERLYQSFCLSCPQSYIYQRSILPSSIGFRHISLLIVLVIVYPHYQHFPL